MEYEMLDEIVERKYSEDQTDKSDVLEACKEAFLLGQMSIGRHDSDCSLHNAPALEVKPCDCSRRVLVNDAIYSKYDNGI